MNFSGFLNFVESQASYFPPKSKLHSHCEVMQCTMIKNHVLTPRFTHKQEFDQSEHQQQKTANKDITQNAELFF